MNISINISDAMDISYLPFPIKSPIYIYNKNHNYFILKYLTKFRSFFPPTKDLKGKFKMNYTKNMPKNEFDNLYLVYWFII